MYETRISWISKIVLVSLWTDLTRMRYISQIFHSVCFSDLLEDQSKKVRRLWNSKFQQCSHFRAKDLASWEEPMYQKYFLAFAIQCGKIRNYYRHLAVSGTFAIKQSWKSSKNIKVLVELESLAACFIHLVASFICF